MESDLQLLARWISESKRAVFFGGAGVSTESGVPDFRSVDGLYAQQYAYPPETILSHSFFMKRPEEFYRFYRAKMLFPSARPNAAHTALARWEAQGHLSCVITQNIDGLHQMAGSKNVCELHGSVLRNACMRCGTFYSLEDVLAQDGVPRCSCGGMIKPDVVLYEEPLDQEVMEQAIDALMSADLLIVGGTSLVVYPAAGFIDAYRGSRLALINKSPTSRDDMASVIIREPIGETFAQIDAIISGANA